jgi:predicted GH43/DUF377 family glycosyl hydrolase
LGDQTLLLLRVEDMTGFSHLTVAKSGDGYNNWQIDPRPTFTADPENYPEELYGIEDPRVVHVPELQKYVITYTAFSENGPCVSLAQTEDFRSFERNGVVLPPENKDAVIFPRKMKNKWYILHRPMPSNHSSQAHIWIASSPDLVHWGDHKILVRARNGGWWDCDKIGIGPQPVETSEGWLLIYHGVRITASGSIYRLGLALLDLDDPYRVIRRGKQWVFGPQDPYEQIGDVPNVTFPCGVVTREDTGELLMYYGAADTSMAVASAKISDLLEFLKHNSE